MTTATTAAPPERLTDGLPLEERQASDSYRQILRSSALIGGSSIVTVVVSILRVKILALFLGPAGVGLVGLYSAILELSQNLAGMGLNSSGVRQIAKAAGHGDRLCLARTATVLERTSLALGLVGALSLVLLRGPVSNWTFSSPEFAGPIALLAAGVLFRTVSDSQSALIQGLRRIGDLARIAIISAVLGTVIGLPFVLVFEENGIVPMLLSGAGTTLAATWWYRRKVDVQSAPLSGMQIRTEAEALLTLGLAFMTTAVLTSGAAYLIRSVVAATSGLESAGLYQSAWALGGLYTGFILQAMGSDFYPRLAAVSDDNAECNRLVNEQARIGMLLAGPGVIATLTFAPVVVDLFYARTFTGAIQPLRWICMGMAFRVIAWPMGYIVLAKGARGTLLLTEVAAAVVHVGLAVALLGPFGVEGATMAFFGLYVWHGTLIYVIVRRLSGFRWSVDNLRTGAYFICLISVAFVGFRVLRSPLALGLGVAVLLASSAYSLQSLHRLFPDNRLARTRLATVLFTRN